MTNRYLKVSTDESYRETQPHGNPDFPFRYYLENVYEFDFHSIAWHWHPEFEIIYVRDGSIDCLIGTDRIELAQGYGLFVNSGVLHCYQARADNVMPNIVFAPELLGEKQGRIYTKYVRPIVESGMPYQILDPSVAWQSEILQVLQAVFELQNRGDSCELETSAQIFRLWQILSQNMPSQSIATSNHDAIYARQLSESDSVKRYCGDRLHRRKHRVANFSTGDSHFARRVLDSVSACARRGIALDDR